MKNFFHTTYLILLSIVLLTACSTDNEDTSKPSIVTEVASKTEGNLKFTVKSKQPKFIAETTTPILVEITDVKDANNKEFTNTSMNILMHMTMADGHKMQHSAPITQLTKVPGTSNIFQGELMLTMAGNEEGKNYWTLEISTTNKGQQIKSVITLLVDNNSSKDMKSLQKFRYEGNQYIMAMHETNPLKVGDNPFAVSVFKNVNNAMEFPVASEFKIVIDPRMPDMGNHGVGKIIPPLNYNLQTQTYQGIITFNMTGYWYINLLVTTQQGTVVAGKNVAPESKENSDIYFEVQF